MVKLIDKSFKGSHNSYINSYLQVDFISTLSFLLNERKYQYASEKEYKDIVNHIKYMLEIGVQFFEFDPCILEGNLCITHTFKTSPLSELQIEKVYDFKTLFDMLIPVFEEQLNRSLLFLYFDSIESSTDDQVNNLFETRYSRFVAKYCIPNKIDFSNQLEVSNKAIILYNNDSSNSTCNGYMISLKDFIEGNKTSSSILNISNIEASIIPKVNIFTRVYPSDRIFSLNYNEDQFKDKFNIISLNYIKLF